MKAFRTTPLIFVPLFLSGTVFANLEGLEVPINPFAGPAVNVADPALEAETCLQIGGYWQGSCDTTDGKKQLALEIHQRGCQALKVGEQWLPIGGQHTAVQNQDSATRTHTLTLIWDNNRNKLLGHGQSLGQMTLKNRSSQFQHKNKFTLEKTGGVLVVTVDSQVDSFVNDFKKQSKTEYTCRLEDKNGPKPAPKEWHEKEWPAKDWNPEEPNQRTEAIPDPDAEIEE